MPHHEHGGLTDGQIQDFINNGFVRLDKAFSADVAARCRDELWSEIGLSPDDPTEWTQPVIRVASKSSEPFFQAANTPRLHRAYDQLVGNGRWLAPLGLGTFPIRFPSPLSAGDDGWHVDVSFGDSPDFMEWRANIKSSGRALLMLFLLSDVGDNDAPTRIRRGSHSVIARELLPYGERGASLRQLAADGFASTRDCRLAWRQALPARCSCAILSSFMRRRRTEELNRALWPSHPSFLGRNSTRHRHPRPSRPLFAKPAD